MSAAFVVETAASAIWCLVFYQLGRLRERRQRRGGYGWWLGYRAGLQHALAMVRGRGRFTVEVHETQKFKAN